MPENTSFRIGAPAALRAPARRALYPDAPAIAVHADGLEDSAPLVAEVCAAEGLGTIQQVQLKESTRLARAESLARIHEASGADPKHLMFDAAQYKGKNRRIGAVPLSQDWIRTQRRLGCRFALTDSPYIPAGDVDAINSVLAQAAAMSRDDVLAALPLHLDWLKVDSELLLELIETHAVPVGLILEHPADPLGVKSAVAGLIHVLSANTKVALLRTDLSAIGAVAFNGSMGAIGTRASLRHLGTGGGGAARGPSAYVPHTMVFRLFETINNAIALAPEHPQWFSCDCRYCDGRMLSYLATPQQAYLHTMAAAAGSAQHVLGLADPEAQRQSWAQTCLSKQLINLELNIRLGGGWEPPSFQGAWHAALA